MGCKEGLSECCWVESNLLWCPASNRYECRICGMQMEEKEKKKMAEAKKLAQKLEDVLSSLDDKTTIEFFSGKKHVGIDIGVVRKGWGWGHITIAHNLEDKTWHLDDEYTSRETVEKFLHDAIPAFLDKLYGKGHIKIENTKEDHIGLVFKIPKEEKDEGKGEEK